MVSPQHALGYGQIHNSMKFLSADLTSLDTEVFLRETNLSPTLASKTLKTQRANFYKAIIPLKPSTKLRERIMDVVMVTDVAFQLFGKNQKETGAWLMAENILLFGASPFDVCVRGDGTALVKWLLDRAGIKPAAIKNESK